MKDLLFFFKCLKALYDLDISSFVVHFLHALVLAEDISRLGISASLIVVESLFNSIVFIWNSLPTNIVESASFLFQT